MKNIKYLGHGRHRHAFLIGNHVYKIPRISVLIEGIQACLNEQRLWRTNQSEYLAPVVAGIPGILVVMPYFEVKTGIHRPAGFHDKLRELFKLEDLCAYNVGWRDGNPVVIDYGSINGGACSVMFTDEVVRNRLAGRSSGWVD